MRASVLLVLLVIMPTAAGAEPAHALAGEGRYQLMEVNDRIVRLDTRTGRFELCRMDGEGWACLLAQDERERLMATIADLTRRVAALETARAADAGRSAAVPAAPAGPPSAVAPLPQQVAAGPVPGNTVPPMTGKPVDISPRAAAPEANPGLLRRIARLLPDIGW